MTENGLQTSGALFEAVQLARVFEDSKTFPDSVPLAPPERIRDEFNALVGDFVRRRFALPGQGAGMSESVRPAPSLAAHIDRLWPTLTRPADRADAPHGSLIPLPHPYVVPGGRFREIYYWDSYFTMLGLLASKRLDLVENMVRNFAWLVDTHGHIPNGNRSYFLSRSQPPMFAFMLRLLERERGIDAIRPYLPQAEREYAYWMSRTPAPHNGRAMPDRHTVRLADGALLNRYWDARNTPREESFAEDVELHARAAPQQQDELYRNLRAGAESGWDFSSRWCDEDGRLDSIRTTELIPVDLNCLLFRIERMLGDWLAQLDEPRAVDYRLAAERRRAAVVKHCWNEDRGWFFDWSWRDGAQSGCWSLAGVFPLYCGLADEAQAARVARNVAERFLRPGGVVTTLTDSHEQWDSPNGWAPLQWVAVQGLLDYGYEELAREIATRFVGLADQVWRRTGKVMEKYDVCDLSLDAGGGEYPVQDGFGWTNGVVRAFIERFELDAYRGS
ncbi:alpha,alpha-trehalase TreF [Aromatoleum toluolicum]|uniref:Alpha,alpha-trehalase TreF n=1 Tax=Aromatoleum toluolicum TaxID=90060 RepID=A0ABX1NFY0_9RHOO|nr:alpha,alpha-trehalase TreF [Aromatoleum toluolicum]NMF98190.1 alpha,alpha-trehalase TreF [Aromatoleum toluolicum]